MASWHMASGPVCTALFTILGGAVNRAIIANSALGADEDNCADDGKHKAEEGEDAPCLSGAALQL